MKYELHPDAELELYEAAAYYEASVPGLCVRFGDEIERVVGLSARSSGNGARIDEDLRHFVLLRFPFSVVYAITGDRIYIVAIAHGSREPDYRKHRQSHV